MYNARKHAHSIHYNYVCFQILGCLRLCIITLNCFIFPSVTSESTINDWHLFLPKCLLVIAPDVQLTISCVFLHLLLALFPGSPLTPTRERLGMRGYLLYYSWFLYNFFQCAQPFLNICLFPVFMIMCIIHSESFGVWQELICGNVLHVSWICTLILSLKVDPSASVNTVVAEHFYYINVIVFFFSTRHAGSNCAGTTGCVVH